MTTTEITCDSCDAACCRLQVILVDDNRVPETMTEQSSWGGEVMLRRDDGWCTALDRTTMLCTIYDDRPQICRDFEMGSVECINERDASFSLL
ncbi:zinc/iron-chelating domain-containing protein [Solemya pervernicosa gill symbiont]|uniref:Zinc/iron-chelating domain-containing protein n=2 Tax=Gammaproteobacteria incertae sedis TaxID=118884 RepID=A0A1T2L2N1_9GAMM|nr:YkgJ family cysteine cluster protein [Candidatus Reidiella endopervernicosa]OOZ39331.1 zinc/iron-chelating domain-containing protein [Solemya pervernicosa gill symbiont]QKQ28139.1 YkgJ family cysteine cluster protein [Candidatus Reidiella endopervernicosa]